MATDWKVENNSLSAGDQTKTIYNLIRNSIIVDKGSFPFKPEFGSELYKLKREKRTERTRLLAIRYATEALSWIKRSGKAISISAIAENDSSSNNRINLKIEVLNASGETITFQTFVEVS